MFSGKTSELSEYVRQMFQNRFINRGLAMPSLFYTDECCEDREMMKGICQTLADSGTDAWLVDDIQAPLNLPPFEPLGFVIPQKAISTTEGMEAMTLQFVNVAEESNDFVFGLDCEWIPFAFSGLNTTPVATIQIAHKSGLVGVFQVAHYKLNGEIANVKVPDNFVQFLNSKQYLFVGVSVNSDKRRIIERCRIKY